MKFSTHLLKLDTLTVKQRQWANRFALSLYLVSALAIWRQFFFSQSPFDPKKDFSGQTAMCAASTSVAGSVQSKLHVGAVTTPVGSNIAGLKLWSSVATWEGNLQPTLSDDVLIPANSVVVLDKSIKVKSLRVEGKLIIDLTKDITIETEYIVVSGLSAYFEWGTPNQTYNKSGGITLVGTDKTVKIPGTTIESKALVVENGATIVLNGEAQTSWTNLAANASVDADKITIATATSNWKIGDEILIAPSRLSWTEGE